MEIWLASVFGLHDIDNAFDRVPFGNVRHGIFGSVPAEMLHVSGNGIMQYQLDVIHEIISSGQHKRKTLHHRFCEPIDGLFNLTQLMIKWH